MSLYNLQNTCLVYKDTGFHSRCTEMSGWWLCFKHLPGQSKISLRGIRAIRLTLTPATFTKRA